MTRIPLHLDCVRTAEGMLIHLTQGVPFAEGQLENDAPVRVVGESGMAFPTQATTLATWRPDMRYVKWLLIDAQLPASFSDRGMRIFLEHGPGVEWAEPEDPIRVQHDKLIEPNSNVEITNSCLELKFKAGASDFLRGAWVPAARGWLDLLRGRPGPYSHMTDGGGRLYDSFSAAPAPVLTVEDAGPVRASVCVRGCHADEEGRPFCKYVLRIHAFAGSSDLRIFHTFILDQDPDYTEFLGIGMMFPLDLGGTLRCAIGGEDCAHWAERWNEAHFLQRSDEAYEIAVDGRPFASGGWTRGWASLAGDRGCAVVALRDLWQEFPKGIRLSPDGMDIEFWPEASGRTMNFDVPWDERPISACEFHRPDELLAEMERRPTAGVNLKGFYGNQDIEEGQTEGNEASIRDAKAFAEEHLKGRRVTYGDTSHNGRAWGIAKTHEFRLHLSAEPMDDATAEIWAAGVQRPATAFAAPDYACETGVLVFTHPQDKEHFREVEEALESVFDELWLKPVEECRLYGDLDYGDLVNCHQRCNGHVYRVFRDEPGFKITDLIGWHNNEAYDMAYSLIQYAIRTGRRKHWALAEAFAEHLRDVDTIHHHPLRPDWVGLSHVHNMMHWNGGPSHSHTLVHGWLLHYFLTGDRRSLDVAREAADNVLGRQEPCGIVSNRGGVLRREFSSPMANLWAFHQATWEEKYGDCAKRTLSWFLRTQTPCGALPRDVFTSGPRGAEPRVSEDLICSGAGGMETLTFAEAHRLTQDPAIRKAVLALAEWILDSIESGLGMSTRPPDGPPAKKETFPPDRMDLWHMMIPSVNLAQAYQLTGDERYVAPLRRLVQEAPEMLADWAAMTGRTCWQKTGLGMQVMASALAAVAESEGRAVAQ